MRRYVDGDEVELPSSGARVVASADRLIVHSRTGTQSALAVAIGDTVLVSFRGRQYRVERQAPQRRHSAGASDGELRAHMPGQVVAVLLEPGAVVSAGQTVLVIEAMKTQQPFAAPHDGTVERVEVREGEQVTDGQLLAVVTPR